MTMILHTYDLLALTDIGTGTARIERQFRRKTPRDEFVGGIDFSRLIPTGLLWSIRWWFEVLVRSLGGAPCDPASNQKSPGVLTMTATSSVYANLPLGRGVE
ncbi:MAG TPA: hypothetical protein VF178_10150 [Gemmatimonadaceae bacterium]